METIIRPQIWQEHNFEIEYLYGSGLALRNVERVTEYADHLEVTANDGKLYTIMLRNVKWIMAKPKS